MRHLEWSAEALDDLDAIVEYISDRNPAAALRLADLIERTANQLLDHPFLYRPGREADTREAVVHPNYILIYRVEERVILIVAVIHARRRYP